MKLRITLPVLLPWVKCSHLDSPYVCGQLRDQGPGGLSKHYRGDSALPHVMSYPLADLTDLFS